MMTEKLTTEQLLDYIPIPESEVKKCRIGGFLELDSFVILHKGRNRWRVIMTK